MSLWDDISAGVGGALGVIPGAITGLASGSNPLNGMGGQIGNVLFGGLGKPTNINSYIPNNPQQQAINAMLGQNAAQLDPTQQAAFRQMQMQQAQQLQRIASGQQQGAGELAAQRQVNNALAAQQAQARMARGGGNAGLAMLNSARNSANVGLAGAGQAQQAALTDQMAAQNALSGVLNQGRGQDLTLAGQNAQLQQNQYGQNLGALTGLNSQQLGAAGQSMNATLGQQGIAGGLLNTAGALLAHSDEDLKHEIEPAGESINDMLLKISEPKSYRYKNEAKHGTGERVGIMAQDLMKSEAGRKMVRRTADGLAIDVGQVASIAIAKAADHERRMRKLEKRA
jgi:hypothetical protein